MTSTSRDPTAASAPGAAAAVAPIQAPHPPPLAVDAFGKLAGPDVTIGLGSSELRVYAVFDVDPETKKVRVKVVDDTGRLIRMIPPESVAAMLAAMAGRG